MRKGLLILFVLLLSLNTFAQNVKSPDGKLSLSFGLSGDGEPTYMLSIDGKPVVQKSRLGIELKEQPGLTKGFTIVKAEPSQMDETWAPVWGEEKQIRNHYRELAVTLQQASVNSRRMIIRFRLFDDGLGFRYEFPEQNELKYFTVSDEKTEFNLTGDHKTFWIPGDYDTNEYAYSTTRLSEIDATKGKAAQEIAFRWVIPANAVQTPLMMKTSEGLYINIHEAALVNYPAMDLLIDNLADKQTFRLSSHLVPDAVGNKAYLQAPAKTPWRTIVVSDKAADILASRLILNLNEHSKIQDVSWIKPQKYVGNGVLVEGWNVGWEDWFGNWKEDVFDFVTPYPDFNVNELQEYASAKHVKLIMHHETSASVTNYERRMDEAIRFMKQHGYDSVKTGYVGRIIPRGEHHDGQWMVNHYIRVAEKMAQNRIMLDAHEPVRPTGLHRTYPNWLACEAARGNEFNAWSVGNPPEHETILPFTRLMGGPMDYTPGIFQIKLNSYQPGKKEQVHTTLAKQLALYVTMYSPLQMAADLPGNYERFMDAFQFIKDVPVDWDDTRILEAEPGDYLAIARKAKNKDEWYIGSITDEQPRASNIPLSYLTPKRWYVATLYADAANAHWENNPMAYQIQNFLVNDQTRLKINLASGGGAAISLKPASEQDLKKWKRYQ